MAPPGACHRLFRRGDCALPNALAHRRIGGPVADLGRRRARCRARRRRVPRASRRRRHARRRRRAGVVGRRRSAAVVGRRTARGLRADDDVRLRLRRPRRRSPSAGAGMRRAALRPRHTVGVVVRMVVAGAARRRRHRRPAGSDRTAHRRRRCALVLFAITEIGRLAGAARTGTDTVDAATTEPTARSAIRPATIAVAALGRTGGHGRRRVARPARARRRLRPRSSTAEGTVCNGHAELCDRPLRRGRLRRLAQRHVRRRRNRAGSSPSSSTRSRCSSTRGCEPCSSTCGRASRPARSCGPRPAATTRRWRSPRRSSGRRSSPPPLRIADSVAGAGHRDRGPLPVPRPVRDRVDPVPRDARRAAHVAGRQPRRGRHAVHRGPRRLAADRRRRRDGRAAAVRARPGRRASRGRRSAR